MDDLTTFSDEVAVKSIAELKAKSDIEIREKMADSLRRLFVSSNVWILALVFLCYILDMFMIFVGKYESTERLIDAALIMTLVGATTVQLGTLMGVVGGYLFKREDGQTQ